MRMIATSLLLLLTLSAGMCSQDPATNIAAYIEKIQAASIQLCGFEPTASTVANIIGAATGNSGATIAVTAAAHGICDAVTRTASVDTLVGTVPEYNGVLIAGEVVDEAIFEDYKK